MDLGIKSLQEVSSDIAITVERRGGLYDDSVVVDPFYKHLYEKELVLFDHLTRLATERYYDDSNRRLKFGIINCADIGGFACVGEEDIDFIGIHFGTISLVSAIFTRMLCNSNIFPHIGNPSLETNTGQSFYIPVKEDLKDFPAIRPNCPIRGTFSKLLVLTGLNFIFGHEIAHISNGHFGIINKTKHNDPEKRRLALSPLENQAIELDADRGAAEWTLLYSEISRGARPLVQVEGNDSLGIAWRELYVNEIETLRYCFFACYITLRMTSPDHWSPDTQQACYLPLPPFRMASLIQVYIFFLMEFHGLSFENAQRRVNEWFIETEQAFTDLLGESGKGELQLNGIASFFRDVGDYSEMVDKAFKSLADELSEYAMSETSKTAQERPKTCGYVVMKGLQKGVEFIGILEANLIKTNIKGLDLQCLAQGCHGIFRSPFQVRFVPEFAGDMLEVALTSDGVNRTVSVEGLESYELVELESISDKLELLRFALQNSNCPSLKNDLIKLLAAEKA
ncbi:hypothetical protein I5412_14270 [Citrobacter koseri]|uniref:hypothetical protein n=1 Tax=Citrobacter koseri TaxID=545 RepID=UPI00106FB7A1|nr:hypothetical protein [Citrobacter koseri]MBJ8876138.1 hypothetical protein [Citrobacter koseri]VFS12778.1 Uncharacterised protein [Citrobacter koseri]